MILKIPTNRASTTHPSQHRTNRAEENLIFVVVGFARDRSGGRPDTGRRGLDARGNEFQRIRQESISVALVVDETTVSLGVITLHNQIDGASVVVTGDRRATGSTIAKSKKVGKENRGFSKPSDRRKIESARCSTVACWPCGGGGGWCFDL